MKIEGLDRLQHVLNGLSGSEAMSALRGPMTKAGADILAKSKAAAPRMDGTLVNSANQSARTGLSTIEITLGYNTIYAYKVHENPRTGHTGGIGPRGQRYRKWAHSGGPKYLERPMNEAQGSIWDDVARGVEAWLRRSV